MRKNRNRGKAKKPKVLIKGARVGPMPVLSGTHVQWLRPKPMGKP